MRELQVMELSFSELMLESSSMTLSIMLLENIDTHFYH